MVLCAAQRDKKWQQAAPKHVQRLSSTSTTANYSDIRMHRRPINPLNPVSLLSFVGLELRASNVCVDPPFELRSVEALYDLQGSVIR